MQSLPPQCTLQSTQLQNYTIEIIKLSGLFDAFIGLLILFSHRLGGILGITKFVAALALGYLPWSDKYLESYYQREKVNKK